MIFISYSHQDRSKVIPIVNLIIEEFGSENVFLDTGKNGPEDNYWKNIKIGLKTSKYFIIFNSVNYDESSACGNELFKAMNIMENIKIIEIKLDKTPSNKLLIG